VWIGPPGDARDGRIPPGWESGVYKLWDVPEREVLKRITVLGFTLLQLKT
jgi:hypothetical protein